MFYNIKMLKFLLWTYHIFGGIMSIGKLTNNYGYTLMELIIAMAIISTISAAAVPYYARYIASTKENVCIINRQTIIYEYRLYYINEPEITLSDYISIYYSGVEDHLCPSEGIYTSSGSGEMIELNCSVHHDVLTESNVGPTQTEMPPEPTPALLPVSTAADTCETG